MVSDELPMGVPPHRFQIKTSPHDDQIPPRPYGSTVSEAGHLHYVDVTHPYVLPPTTSRFDIAHTYNDFQVSDPSPAPYHGELNPHLRLTHPSHDLSPAGSEPSDNTPTDCGILGLCRPPEIYNLWESLYYSPNLLPNATYGLSPPTLHHSTLNPTLYPEFPCHRSSWSTANTQVNHIDENLPPPSNDYPPAFALHDTSSSPGPHLGDTSEPYSGTLDAPASYPCLWTEGGVICNVTVQATRSYMNRHLHAYHGFGGCDTRQTRCHWARCGETMQQGSIARHMVTCHLQAKVTCPMCSKKLSRQDVISKHQRVCPAASAWRS